MEFSGHHAPIVSPLTGSFVEPPVPLNDLAFGTAETAAVKNRAAAYTHMPRHDLFTFTLTQRGNFPPWNQIGRAHV